MNNIVIYILIASATIASPGPGVILSITNSLTYDRKRTTYGILGLSLGMLAVAIVSATSIGLLIATSKKAFLTVQIIGAIYILYMGAKMLLGKRNSLKITSTTDNVETIKTYDGWNLFKQGLFTSSSNPKPILFFMAVFPQFIDSNQAYLPQFLLLALTFCLLVIIIHSCYAELFSVASKYLWKAQDKLYLITKTGGVVLIILALILVINAGKTLLGV